MIEDEETVIVMMYLYLAGYENGIQCIVASPSGLKQTPMD